MRLITFDDGRAGRPGAALPGGGFVDLAIAADVLGQTPAPASARAVLAGGDAVLAAVRAIVDAAQQADPERLRVTGALRPENSALLAPVPDPRVIISTGGNYLSHLAEMKMPPMKEPGGFIKSAGAVIGSGRPIVLPADHPDMVDWEGEFALVVGRPCHNVAAADAMDYIAGYTILNDVSARDWAPEVFAAQDPRSALRAWTLNQLGKQFPGFAPLGPAILTRDEAPDPSNLVLETRVNGVVMQSTKVGDTAFSFGEIIAYFARFHRFLPGDVITTGTPAGVGFARDPKIYLTAGDVVEVEVTGIGVLSNRIETGEQA